MHGRRKIISSRGSRESAWNSQHTKWPLFEDAEAVEHVAERAEECEAGEEVECAGVGGVVHEVVREVVREVVHEVVHEAAERMRLRLRASRSPPVMRE